MPHWIELVFGVRVTKEDSCFVLNGAGYGPWKETSPEMEIGLSVVAMR